MLNGLAAPIEWLVIAVVKFPPRQTYVLERNSCVQNVGSCWLEVRLQAVFDMPVGGRVHRAEAVRGLAVAKRYAYRWRYSLRAKNDWIRVPG